MAPTRYHAGAGGGKPQQRPRGPRRPPPDFDREGLLLPRGVGDRAETASLRARQ
ncbi:MAG: hypothetical protein Kow0092_07030 [Deferrisomatales bacterium]